MCLWCSLWAFSMWYSVYPDRLHSTVCGEIQYVHLGLPWIKQKKAPIRASWNQVFMSLQGGPHAQRWERSGPQGVGIFDCSGVPGCTQCSVSWGQGASGCGGPSMRIS